MDSIPQKELRNQVGQVLHRVEAGESLLVTVAGRPVAELVPTAPKRWVSGERLTEVFRSPQPRGLEDDLTRLPAAVSDLFTA